MTSLRDTLHDKLEEARQTIERMRLDAALLKLEARDRRDELMDELRTLYDDARRKSEDWREVAQGEMNEAKASAETAWGRLKQKIEDVRGDA